MAMAIMMSSNFVGSMRCKSITPAARRASLAVLLRPLHATSTDAVSEASTTSGSMPDLDTHNLAALDKARRAVHTPAQQTSQLVSKQLRNTSKPAPVESAQSHTGHSAYPTLQPAQQLDGRLPEGAAPRAVRKIQPRQTRAAVSAAQPATATQSVTSSQSTSRLPRVSTAQRAPQEQSGNSTPAAPSLKPRLLTPQSRASNPQLGAAKLRPRTSTFVPQVTTHEFSTSKPHAPTAPGSSLASRTPAPPKRPIKGSPNVGLQSQGAHLINWRSLQLPQALRLKRFKERLFLSPTAQRTDLTSEGQPPSLVVVEGLNDLKAVQAALDTSVFVLGGGAALAEDMLPDLQVLGQVAQVLGLQLVVLTDPDWQGRQFRQLLNTHLASQEASGQLVLRHAFVRAEQAMAITATKYHEAGNLGVEHAAPAAIRTALAAALPAYPEGRKEFSMEQLAAHGLAGAWQDRSKVQAPKIRRSLMCMLLGVDVGSTAKALVSFLNRFVSREEYGAVLARVLQQVPLEDEEVAGAAGAALEGGIV